MVYSVPKKDLNFYHSKDSFAIDTVQLKLIRKTNFRDGERVKSVNGINLITTHLVINITRSITSFRLFYSVRKK